MSEIVGTNTSGPGVSGTGSTYGVIGASTGTAAGVVGKNAPNGKGPGVYAQTGSPAPGLLAIGGEATLVDALFGTDLDTAAVNWGGQYTNKAAIFIGDVHLTGALTAGTNTSSASSFTGPVSVAGPLTGTTSEFKGGALTGVHGVNGSGSGDTPKFGCGVNGESEQGYGVYGASKSASGVYGVSSTGLAGEFNGKVSVTGTLDVGANITAKDVILSGADCAEEFDVAEILEPGVVAIVGDDGALSACARAYDKRVAGVISGAGSYHPGIVLDRRQTTRERAPIALIGKVYCKVDASEAPIEVGDLLTTSATAGHAMRAADPARAFGAVIGKALEPLRSGRALVPILVTLQ